jgi:hypothetical protein
VDDGIAAMYLFVRRPDGSPIGYPMTGVMRCGSIEFTTYRKSAKARYLLSDDRVCCIVVDADDPTRGTAVWGHAEPTDAAAFADRTRGDGPIDVPAAVRDTVRDRLLTDKRMVFRVRVDASRPARRVGAAS